MLPMSSRSWNKRLDRDMLFLPKEIENKDLYCFSSSQCIILNICYFFFKFSFRWFFQHVINILSKARNAFCTFVSNKMVNISSKQNGIFFSLRLKLKVREVQSFTGFWYIFLSCHYMYMYLESEKNRRT